MAPGQQAAAGVSGGVRQDSILFVNDTSYITQSETSIAVDPNNPSHLVGGFNDGRAFFCNALPTTDCPSGWTYSLSGFTVSSDGGKSVLKGNDLPSLVESEYNTTSKKYFQGVVVSWGDPSVVAGVDGNFYYASLAVDPLTGANGVMISKSNPNLWSSNSSCVTPLAHNDTNACWTGHLVFGNMTTFAASLEDKDRIAVDTDPSSAYYGYVYVSWDHFYPNGLSSSFLARCNGALVCTMLSGGGAPVISGQDQFAAFATTVVGKDGSVYVAWCNYGTFTSFGPVTCKVRSSSRGGGSFGGIGTILSFMGSLTALPADTVVIGYATESFRTFSFPTLAVDKSSKSNNLYFSIEVCSSGHYYVFLPSAVPFAPTDNPGNCGQSSVVFAKSTNGGGTWSAPEVVSQHGLNIQPNVSVDPVRGDVYVTHYTTQFDVFNHRVDVVAEISTDGGSTFTQRRITSVSNEPNADPEMYDYLAGAGVGSSLLVPQYGDYFEATSLNGRLWILYTGNYATDLGTYKAAPFLASGLASSFGNTIAVSLQTETPVFAGQTVSVGATLSWSNGSAVSSASFPIAVILTPGGASIPLANTTTVQPGTFALSARVPAGASSGLYFVRLEANASGTVGTAQGSFTVNNEIASSSALSSVARELLSIGGNLSLLSQSVVNLGANLGRDLRNLNSSLVASFGGLRSALAELPPQTSIQGLANQLSSSLSTTSNIQTYVLIAVALAAGALVVGLVGLLRKRS